MQTTSEKLEQLLKVLKEQAKTDSRIADILKQHNLFTVLFLLLSGHVFCQDVNTPVPYTLADRDRLTRLEVKVEEGFKSVDARFQVVDARFDGIQKQIDGIQKQIDSLSSYMLVVMVGIFGLIGFIIWDRVSFTKPLESKLYEVRENLKESSVKVNQLIKVLKEQAKTNPQLAETLKQFNLL